MNKQHNGIILKNEQIALNTFKMVIQSDLKEAQPGQFISVLIPGKTLRRPFSVANFANNEITVLYKLKGEGTAYLSSLKEGSEIDFLAPLGNTFDTEGVKSALLIGAGIGIAPMLFLKNKLTVKNFLIAGFKEEQEVIKGADKTVIGGSVMDGINGLIEEFKPDMIYSCGPSIVLQLVCETASKHNLMAQIAMEKVMACGIGVCRGCVIDLQNGKKASVCKDGPVFRGDAVKW